jgi:hypothetical protein
MGRAASRHPRGLGPRLFVIRDARGQIRSTRGTPRLGVEGPVSRHGAPRTPARARHGPIAAQDARPRGHEVSSAPGRADPHVFAPRAAGCRAFLLGHPGVSRSAGIVPPRPGENGARRSEAYESLPGSSADLGRAFGDFPVRDWFWERVPAARSPLEFVATLGMGFEGGNLDHTKRFAECFRSIGDEAGARLEETIFEEELPHVRFAVRWFREWTGCCDFRTWMRQLPPPLSPTLMKGQPLQRAGRLRSGFSESFVADLAAWQGWESGQATASADGLALEIGPDPIWRGEESGI